MEASLQKIVNRFPSPQQGEVTRRINVAVKFGWDEISLLTPDGEEPKYCDLVGTQPASGKTRELPD